MSSTYAVGALMQTSALNVEPKYAGNLQVMCFPEHMMPWPDGGIFKQDAGGCPGDAGSAKAGWVPAGLCRTPSPHPALYGVADWDGALCTGSWGCRTAAAGCGGTQPCRQPVGTWFPSQNSTETPELSGVREVCNTCAGFEFFFHFVSFFPSSFCIPAVACWQSQREHPFRAGLLLSTSGGNTASSNVPTASRVGNSLP